MEIIKKIINSNQYTRAIKDDIRARSYYRSDRISLKNAQKRYKSKDYEAIMIAHSLEKGMSFEKPRPFGKEKVQELIALYDKIDKTKKTAVEIVVNTLREYVKFYEKHGWVDEPEYSVVNKFLKEKQDIAKHEAGVKYISKDDIKTNVDYERFLLGRHSIRDFDDKKVTVDDFKKAINIARLTPTACNRQMVKAVLCKSENAKKAVVTAIKDNLSGFNINTVTPVLVTFDLAAFDAASERNQGWLNAGLFTMNLVNAMHSIGIASCICEFRINPIREKKLKKELGIAENERVAVAIMIGYYRDKNKVYVSQRLTSDELVDIV